MVAIPKLTDCNPGMRATGFAMIVAVAPVEEVTKGGIILAASTKDKEQLVEVRGRVVSMSPACFDFASFPQGSTPNVGDAVQFAKLAGVMTKGLDGREYRVVQDRDILAILDEEAA